MPLLSQKRSLFKRLLLAVVYGNKNKVMIVQKCEMCEPNLLLPVTWAATCCHYFIPWLLINVRNVELLLIDFQPIFTISNDVESLLNPVCVSNVFYDFHNSLNTSFFVFVLVFSTFSFSLFSLEAKRTVIVASYVLWMSASWCNFTSAMRSQLTTRTSF